MARRKPSIDERFEEVRLVFFGVCDKFWRKYGGDFEDVISKGHELFMEILISHDPRRSELGADVRFRVWKGLLEDREAEARRRRLFPIDPRPDLDLIEARPDLGQFDIKSFLEDLTTDVQTVVRLALDTPRPVAKAAAARGGKMGYYADLRHAIKQYLLTAGWSQRRVYGGFAGVREAIRC